MSTRPPMADPANAKATDRRSSNRPVASYRSGSTSSSSSTGGRMVVVRKVSAGSWAIGKSSGRSPAGNDRTATRASAMPAAVAGSQPASEATSDPSGGGS